MSRTLEQVIVDARGELPVLRKHGQSALADAIERLCDDVSAAALDYLTWLSESDARLRSGRTVEWLRGRFSEWASEGLAELRQGRRYYRQVVIPQRAHISAARDAGRRGERIA